MDRLIVTIMTRQRQAICWDVPYVRRIIIWLEEFHGWYVPISILIAVIALMEWWGGTVPNVLNVDRISLQAIKIYISAYCCKTSTITQLKYKTINRQYKWTSPSTQTINISRSLNFIHQIHWLKDPNLHGMDCYLIKLYPPKENSNFALTLFFRFIITLKSALSTFPQK